MNSFRSQDLLNRKCVCKRGVVGIPTIIKDGVFYGLTLDGKPWQSKIPKLLKDQNNEQ